MLAVIDVKGKHLGRALWAKIIKKDITIKSQSALADGLQYWAISNTASIQ